MSKSKSAINAKPFLKQKEQKKTARKIQNTINAKVQRERELDPSYDIRQNILMARFFPELSK